MSLNPNIGIYVIVMVDAHGLSRGRCAQLLNAINNSIDENSRQQYLRGFYYLESFDIVAFTKKNDHYRDIPLNENRPLLATGERGKTNEKQRIDNGNGLPQQSRLIDFKTTANPAGELCVERAIEKYKRGHKGNQRYQLYLNE